MALSAAEEESIESVKRWWRESGRSLMMGVVIVALGYAGWQLWQSNQNRTAAQASALYDELSTLVVTEPGAQISSEDKARATELIAELKAEHSGSVYALYGALFGARLAVEQNELGTARQELEWLLDNTRSGLFNSTDETLIWIAQLRLGYVLLASGETDSALALVDSVEPSAMQAQFDELRGDIYLAQGQQEQALSAYESAVAAGNDTPALQMKVNELK